MLHAPFIRNRQRICAVWHEPTSFWPMPTRPGRMARTYKARHFNREPGPAPTELTTWRLRCRYSTNSSWTKTQDDCRHRRRRRHSPGARANANLAGIPFARSPAPGDSSQSIETCDAAMRRGRHRSRHDAPASNWPTIRPGGRRRFRSSSSVAAVEDRVRATRQWPWAASRSAASRSCRSSCSTRFSARPRNCLIPIL